jgi:hypothetical protein
MTGNSEPPTSHQQSIIPKSKRVSFQIFHNIISGPLEIQSFYELHRLFQLVAACDVVKFPVSKLLQHRIHRLPLISLGQLQKNCRSRVCPPCKSPDAYVVTELA